MHIKNFRKILFVVIVLTQLISCKEKKCKQDDSFSGIVTERIIIADFPKAGEVGPGQYLIETDSAYQLAFSDATNLSPIDFSTYSLLGQYGSGTCKIKFHSDVQSNDDAKAYHYRLSVYDCHTFYKKGCGGYNWILVPKLPEGWTVTFEKREY